jgi:two-component system KDP operon response regulator KdpE
MNARIRILLIEDNKNTCSYISALLDKNGYTTTTALTGREGLSLAASLCPNLILLDLGLPDMDGFQVLEQLRGWSHVPILIVSACNEEQEKVAALNLGADDYITKPFYPNELTARIRTALRHSRGNAHSQVYKALNLEIDFDKRILRLEGKRVHLTQIEYQLLSLLAENAGRVLTYNTILRRIWGPYAEENNQILRVNMANIRRKIEQNPAQPQYVFTEVGVGYRMLENENG